MIRKIRKEDKTDYIKMAQDFYSSDAVCHNISQKYMENAFAELMRSDVYAEGYILEWEERAAGYALLAKTFSQEAGGMVLWLEEIYICPTFRGNGLGQEFLDFLRQYAAGKFKRIRLEADPDNEGARSLYYRMGFDELSYFQMVMDF